MVYTCTQVAPGNELSSFCEERGLIIRRRFFESGGFRRRRALLSARLPPCLPQGFAHMHTQKEGASCPGSGCTPLQSKG